MTGYDGSAADIASDYTSVMAPSKMVGTIHKGPEQTTATSTPQASASKPGHGTGRTA